METPYAPTFYGMDDVKEIRSPHILDPRGAVPQSGVELGKPALQEKVVSAASFSANKRSEVFAPKPSQEQYPQDEAESQEEKQPTERFSITPEFEEWYKAQYGVDSLSDAQLKRRLEEKMTGIYD